VIHRDLALRNVLLDDMFRARVCDFGLSRMNTGIDNATATLLGPIAWMAPEAFEGRYSAKSDVYRYKQNALITDCLA
jgi:serine/threonine protein kinase